MQGKHPLYAQVAMDTNTICRIESAFQLALGLLQQRGVRDAVAASIGHADTDQPSNTEEASVQARALDASEEVYRQQHAYMIDDEELDPMGWGFSIDQP